MALDRREAIRRLRAAARAVDPALRLDEGAVHPRTKAAPDDDYPGYEYGLRRGPGHAVLFMPAEDLEAGDWQARVAEKLTVAARYVETLARRGQV